MKTFGELKAGDKVYSLNYDDWGVLTEHIVDEVKRNDWRTAIKVKGYLKHQIIGDASGDKADLKLFNINEGTIGEIAPSVEGVKKYWIDEINLRISKIKSKIADLNKMLENQYKDLDIIQSINS